MEIAQEILHENCRLNHSYLIEMDGHKYQAKFKGYPGNNQYAPTFEINSDNGNLRILRELD